MKSCPVVEEASKEAHLTVLKQLVVRFNMKGDARS